LPDLNTIVWVWQSLKKQEIKQDDEKGKKKGAGTPAAHEAVQRSEYFEASAVWEKDGR
jgi:nucleolar pre-ribosomal-associated protein 1